MKSCGQNVTGQPVSEQIRNSYLYPTYRGQKFSFFRVGVIRKIENLEIHDEIDNFGWIKRYVSVDLGDIGDFKGYRGIKGNTIFSLEYYVGYLRIWEINRDFVD